MYYHIFFLQLLSVALNAFIVDVIYNIDSREMHYVEGDQKVSASSFFLNLGSKCFFPTLFENAKRSFSPQPILVLLVEPHQLLSH